MATPDPGSALKAVDTLHEVMTAWIGGTAPHSPKAIAAYADSFHPDFERVSATGVVSGRQEAIDRFETMWALRPGLRMDVENGHEISVTEKLAVIRYDIHRTGHGKDERRHATAVAVWQDRRWQWLLVQETWAASEGASPAEG